MLQFTYSAVHSLFFYLSPLSSFHYYGVVIKFILFFFTDEFDAYIVVSFVNATLVLSIGETVEEVTDSGFLGTTPTLGCSSLGDNALLQVIIFCKILLSSHVIDLNYLNRFIPKEFDT